MRIGADYEITGCYDSLFRQEGMFDSHSAYLEVMFQPVFSAKILRDFDCWADLISLLGVK